MIEEANRDGELLSRCRAGDQEGFRELVEQHHERVYRVAFALLGNDGDAQEVEQEAFVKAWRSLDGFRGDASIGTWLTRIAMNAARDHLRRRRARGVWHRLLELRVGAQSSDGGLDGLAERERIQQAVRRLSPPLRDAIVLRYSAQLSTREIAAALGCPEGTVKSRINAGLAKLRDTLEAESTIPDQPPHSKEVRL